MLHQLVFVYVENHVEQALVILLQLSVVLTNLKQLCVISFSLYLFQIPSVYKLLLMFFLIGNLTVCSLGIPSYFKLITQLYFLLIKY